MAACKHCRHGRHSAPFAMSSTKMFKIKNWISWVIETFTTVNNVETQTIEKQRIRCEWLWQKLWANKIYNNGGASNAKRMLFNLHNNVTTLMLLVNDVLVQIDPVEECARTESNRSFLCSFFCVCVFLYIVDDYYRIPK